MIRPHPILSRAVLMAMIVAPLGIMGVLSINVLWPALKNPESKFYSSSIGYPALQRLAGKPIAVQTVSVVSTTLEDGVAAPGESVALQQVGVQPLVSGPVEKVYVVEGQLVHQGQPLLQIERAPFLNAVSTVRNDMTIAEVNLKSLQESAKEQLVMLKANVEAAKEQLTIAAAQFKQLSSLAKTGAIQKVQLYNSQSLYITNKNNLITQEQTLATTQNTLNQQIENAHLNLENNRIALQNAQRDLNHTVLYASNDGLVSQVNIHSGEVVSSQLLSNTTPVVTLTQNIVFKAYIDQARLNAVKVGDQAMVRLTAYPGRVYQGRVIRLNPTVQTNVVQPPIRVGVDRQYTYPVWITINSLQMPPGLQGYVQFINRGKTKLTIPENAITHLSGGEGMVMIAESGRAVVKQVKLGRVFDNQREVLKGLTSGEQVVLSPRALNPGDRIKPQFVQREELSSGKI